MPINDVENRAAGGAVKPVDLVAVLLVAAAAVIVFRGTLDYFFVQDDFAALARARGLLPRFAEPWRWLSLQFYFDVMRPLAALNPLPYHAVSLGGHALAGIGVYALVRRFVPPAGAFVASTFFVCHAAHFTAVYWISTIGDIYAVVFGLAALLLALRFDPSRYLAVPLFVAALLCKESILLLPLVVPMLRAVSPGHARPSWSRVLRDPLFLTLFAISCAYLVYFAAQNSLGAAPRTAEEAAYAVSLGGHVWANALTYSGWVANFLVPFVTGFTDAIDPAAHPWGMGLLLLFALGMLLPSLRRRAWWMGGALFVLLLLPVLPLQHHTYHYYLYAPLVGVALCVGLVTDLLLGARQGRNARAALVAASAAALAIALALTVNGSMLVHKIETHPFTLPGTRAEPLIDRARIAGHVIRAVVDADLPPGTTLRMLSPEAQSLAAAGAPGTSGPSRETYWERNVRNALYEGLAVRVFATNVDSVQFVRSAAPGAGARVRYGLYRVTGQTEIHSAAALDSMMMNAAPPADPRTP